MKFKCLTIRQPWAGAIILGVKTEELRSWPLRLRGWLAVHAGKSPVVEAFAEWPEVERESCPYGAVLGLVEVTDCVEDHRCGYAFLLARPLPLLEPMPYTGRLGVYEVEIPAGLLPAELKGE